MPITVPQFATMASVLRQSSSRMLMPSDFLAGIGGCNDGPGLMTLQRKGELVPMLKSAGAL